VLCVDALWWGGSGQPGLALHFFFPDKNTKSDKIFDALPKGFFS